ncbi:nmrA-like family protein [Colletotrichum plurivorum]|uniref:NmrA-like family protein n=1 Tax=Colletotrichum plurivorum TaxID=2175906 RepID=A0A8H6KD23_9PEZI|nr:nmrA-like family protein [Colletotrichum plurivorum]
MGVVAVAGGTGGIGRTIVEQLQLEKKHEFIILTRKIPEKPFAGSASAIRVNYEDVASLTDLFEEKGVDTVISTIFLHSEAAFNAQMNLIRAAEKSSKTHRFIPSEFGAIKTAEFAKEEPFVLPWVRTAEYLKKSTLQYTRFVVGFLMDYWGMPHIQTHMDPYTWAIDVANCRAAIPGSGDDLISVTYSVDVARFITRSLDSQDWPVFSIVVGSDVTLNQLLQIVERIRGTKFQVQDDSVEDLRNNQATVLNKGDGVPRELIEITALFGRVAVSGCLRIPEEGRLNTIYPEIRPSNVEELLEKAWAGKF